MRTNWKYKWKTVMTVVLAASVMICACGKQDGTESEYKKSAKKMEDLFDKKNTDEEEDEKNAEKASGQMNNGKNNSDGDEENDLSGKEQETTMDETELWTEEKLAEMTLEEKAAQMFVVCMDTLTGVESTAEAGDWARQQFWSYPVGGIIMMGVNVQSEEQITNLNAQLKAISQERIGLLPFLCVDEEGGTVKRIAGNPNFPVQDVGDMNLIGAGGDPSRAYQAGFDIGSYLSAYQFNVDFAPDADVLLNPGNTVIGVRSFGSDAELVASMTAQAVSGLRENGICATLKHYPGHGATAEDSHEGFAYSLRTLDELRECEWKPFRSGIEAGAEFIMVGHISYPNILGSDTPATLSGYMVGELLRQELQFDGIIITDAMNMGAISNNYSSADATIMAVQAGADMILEPADFYASYQALIDAVRSGTISEERINESLRRILRVKRRLALGE